MLDVCLLGTAGTIPLPSRRLSAALIRVGGSLVLLDCGEGTQVALRERGWGLRRLKTILITHVHADQVLGLPGLLLSLGFSGKGADEPLTVYGSPPRGGAAGVTRRGTSPALPLARGHGLQLRGLPFSRA